MNDLIRHPQSEAVDFEQRFLASPLRHRLYMHQRVFFALSGMFLIVLSSALGAMALSFPKVLVLCQFLIALVIQLVIFGWVSTPCRCGRYPLLTGTARLQLIRHRNSFTPAQKLIIAFLIGGGASFNMVRIGLALLGLSGLALAMSIPTAITGCYLLACAYLDQTDRHFHHTLISDKEQEEALRLPGNTQAELRKLIMFHLRSGDFEQADYCSNKLLALAEVSHWQ